MLERMSNLDTERIGELARQHARGGYSPSGIVALARHGKLIHAESWGDDGYDLDASFRVASLTKSFTAQALQILRRRGDIGFDDPVTLHLPELEVVAPAHWPELRIRHLLGMSSGLATDNPWGDRQESISRERLSAWAAAGLRLIFAPGTSFEYSNLAYALLGEIIARLSDQDYRDFVTGQLLEPLGLNSSRFSSAELGQVTRSWHRAPPLPGLRGGWSDQPHSGPGAFSSIGGLYSSVNDLLKWTGLFLKPESAAGFGLAAADLIEAQEPLTPRGSGVAEAPLRGTVASGYGLGLFIDNHSGHGKIVSHSGGYPGFTAYMMWHVRSGLTVISSTNGTHSAAPKLARQVLFEAVAAEKSGEPDTTPWPETTAAVAAISSRLAGTEPDGFYDLFAMNVDLDFPLSARLERLDSSLVSLGRLLEPAGQPKFERPSSARWSLPYEFGELELMIELAPVAPFGVQTFSATIVVSGNRFKLF